MKSKFPAWIGPLLIGVAIGLIAGKVTKKIPSQKIGSLPANRGISFDDRYGGAGLLSLKTKEIEDLRSIFQFVENHQIRVEPLLTTLTNDQITAILSLLKEKGNRAPILSVKILSPTEVEVDTGNDAPLSGSGHVYTIMFSEGEWKITGIGQWIS